MLPNEIKPFADQQRKNLDRVKDTLYSLETPANSVPIVLALEDVRRAQRAFDRFEACMADEIQQKNTYRKRWLNTKPQFH